MLKPELQVVVDRLCEDGCKAVNQYISDIQAGMYPYSMQNLGQDERDAVLEELQSIMEIYNRRGMH